MNTIQIMWTRSAQPQVWRIGAWASALAGELDFSSRNNQIGRLTAQDPGRLSGSCFQPDGSGQGPRDGTQLFGGVLGPCVDSLSLVTCQFPWRALSVDGVPARVRSKRAAGEAVGLGEVGASRARPRHTWETGKGEEREQRWLKRQRRREQIVGVVGGSGREGGG